VNTAEIKAAWMNNLWYSAGYLSNHFNEIGQHLASIEVHPIASRIGIGQTSVSFALNPYQHNAHRGWVADIFGDCGEWNFAFRGKRLHPYITVRQHVIGFGLRLGSGTSGAQAE
jgi:hypothetical protein